MILRPLLKLLTAFMTMLALRAQASPYKSDVAAVCAPAGRPVGEIIEMKYHDREENLRRIHGHQFGQSKVSVYLKGFYAAHPAGEIETLQVAADNGNQSLIPKSALKERALKYSTEKQKLENPAGYRQAVIDSFNELMPPQLNFLNWFLDLNDPAISSTSFDPADRSRIGEFYGAMSSIRPDEKLTGKKTIRIIFSNNASESLPYMLPLIAHELQHARTQFADRATVKDPKSAYADSLVDEALAFDVQMQAYLALAKKDPQTFCDWLYVSWSYGDLMIPLSWTMASMEREMASGHYIYDYARRGTYANERYLLSEDGNALRPDLQKRITDMKLRFIR